MVELMFDTGEVLSDVEVEQIRRSAAMGLLTADGQRRLLDAVVELTAQRAHIATVLAALPPSWRQVRIALNEIQRLVAPP